MDKLQIKMALAGICFGIYPLLLNRSKISGNLSSVTFTLVVCTLVSLYVGKELRTLFTMDWSAVRWPFIVGAGALSAVGMLLLTGVLAEASKDRVGLLIVVMLVVNTAVAAGYQVAMDRGLSLARCAGFALAIAAIVLLNKSK